MEEKIKEKETNFEMEELTTLVEPYFYLDESPIYQNKFLIRLRHENLLFPNGTTGSYNVFISRVLNLSYPDFLRYARDRLGAELIGKNNKYVIPYFDYTREVQLLISVLNKRMKLIMFEHDHPYDLVRGEDGKLEKIPFKDNEDNS